MRVMNSTLKRQKSITSQAESISAWCAVFDWPSIVAAFSVGRHGPARSSAARRKIAARSSHGVRDQSFHASADAAIARSTSFAPPLCTVASTCERLCGSTASNVSPAPTPGEGFGAPPAPDVAAGPPPPPADPGGRGDLPRLELREADAQLLALG